MSRHIVEANREKSQINVYRIDEANFKVLFASYPLDRAMALGFEKFAKQLGEDILLDTPIARDVFGL